MKHLLITLTAAATLLLGTVTAANASPISRSNAVSKARSYLQSDSFSYKSLVEQLEYEGFSASDSRYGAGHAGANWMREAVLKAKSYLQSDSFSRRSLIEQLEYEGFTPAQALHGVQATGL